MESGSFRKAWKEVRFCTHVYIHKHICANFTWMVVMRYATNSSKLEFAAQLAPTCVYAAPDIRME